LNAAYQLPR